MALLKTIELNTGVTVTYHRVLRGLVDYEFRAAQIVVGTYLTQQAREDGKQPVYTREYHFSDDAPEEENRAFPFTDTESPRFEAYTALKALPDFADATDV